MKGDVSEAKWLRKKYMGCGGERPAWWAGWWAGCPEPWSGTCPGTGRRTCPCCSGQTGSPRRRNSDTAGFSCLFMLLLSAVNKDSKVAHFTTEAENNESFLLVNVSVCLHCHVPAKPLNVWRYHVKQRKFTSKKRFDTEQKLAQWHFSII